MEILKIIIGIVIAVIGWIIGHYFNSKRDNEANRKKMVTAYLLDAYRKLNTLAGVLAWKNGCPANLPEEINSAIAAIQLLGSSSQVKMARELSEYIVLNHNKIKLDMLVKIIISLRNDLRKELGLKSIDDPVAFLRLVYEGISEKNRTTSFGADA